MVTTKEKTKETNKVLVYSDKRAIEQVNNIAFNNQAFINQIIELTGITEREEILKVASNPKPFIMDLFFKRFPQAKEQSEYLNIVIPEDLQHLQRVIQSVSPNSFKYLTFNNRSNKWEIDSTELERATERYYKYASTPEEIRRYNLASQVVEFVKDLGEYSQHKFLGEMIVRDNSRGGICVNLNFIFHNYNF